MKKNITTNYYTPIYKDGEIIESRFNFAGYDAQEVANYITLCNMVKATKAITKLENEKSKALVKKDSVLYAEKECQQDAWKAWKDAHSTQISADMVKLDKIAQSFLDYFILKVWNDDNSEFCDVVEIAEYVITDGTFNGKRANELKSAINTYLKNTYDCKPLKGSTVKMICRELLQSLKFNRKTGAVVIKGGDSTKISVRRAIWLQIVLSVIHEKQEQEQES